MQVSKGGKVIGVILFLAAIACGVVFLVRYIKSVKPSPATPTIELSETEITF